MNKTEWRAYRFSSWLLDRIIIIISLFFMVIGMYALYDNYMVYNEAKDDSILKYKPGLKMSDFDEPEREVVGNMVAWLTLDDTTIDYPIMQGSDNVEYLDTNPYGEYSLAGSIFLDYRNSPDFTDYYSLIYGHHMDFGAMFGSLDEFLKKEYFDKHKTGTLIVGEKVYKLRIFAVVEGLATERAIFDPIDNYDKTLPYIKKKAKILDKKNILRDGECLLGISTCKYPDITGRTIVYAAIEDWESLEEYEAEMEA